jgi:hypothetical protein
LRCACQGGDVTIVVQILENMAAPAAFTFPDQSKLLPYSEQYTFDQVARRTPQDVLRLMEKEGDVFCEEYGDISRKYGITPLHWAARGNDVSMILKIVRVSGKKFLEMATYEGYTPLYEAVLFSNVDAVRALIQAGACVNAVSMCGNSIISHAYCNYGERATRESRINCAYTLRRHGAEYFPPGVPNWRIAHEVEGLIAGAAWLYEAPALHRVPPDVLRLVEDYASLPYDQPPGDAGAAAAASE